MFTKFLNPVRVVRLAVGMLAALTFAGAAIAQGIDADSRAAAQRWLDNALASARPVGAAALRMEVVLGELDSRLKLAPCSRVEPHVPVGTRLWGKTRLGLRCVEGATRWNVFLPVTVRAFGSAWVVRGDVASGSVLSASDVIEAEVDWAQEDSAIVANASDWVGHVATRALTTGQALRQGMIRPAQVFQAGTVVRVVAQGSGFQISSDGQALSAGVVGQLARVKMENGRVMSGIVLDNRTVKLEI